MNHPGPRLGALPSSASFEALGPQAGFGGPAGMDDVQSRANVLRVWWALRRRWWVPTLCALGAVAALTVYSLLKPPEYVSTGTVQIGMSAFLDGGMDTRSLGRGGVGNIMMTTLRQLLTSHRVVEDAITRTGTQLAEGPARREQREMFLRKMTITPRSETFLVEVEARGRDPRRVVQKVNALMDAFIPFSDEYFRSGLVVRERRLKDQEEALERSLKDAKKREDEFYRKIGEKDFPSEKSNLITAQQRLLERKTAIGLEGDAAQARREGENRFLVDVQNKEIPVEVLAGRRGPDVLASRARLNELKVAYELALRQLQPDHPQLAELRAQLEAEKEATRRALAEMSVAAKATFEEEERRLLSEESKIKKRLEELQSEIRTLDLQEGEYKSIKAEIEGYEKNLETARTRLREIQSAGKSEAGAAIVNRAELPMEAEPRFKPINFAFLALLAFGFGLVLVVAWDHLDDTVQREDDALVLGLPVIGRVPHVDLKVLDEKAHLQGSSWTSEAFGLIRTNMTVAAGGIHKAAILVTSGSPKDGKSFVSANLATSLARTGGRTLIIEADLRRPRLQKVLGTSYDEGLSDVLAGLRNLEDVVQKTDFQGLDLLPAGPCPLNPADLLLRGQFDQLMRTALERYDHVIVDAPPARPLADTSLMAPYVKGVVHVVRVGVSRRRLSAGAIEQIQSVGGRSLGTILNDVPPRAEESYLAYGEYYTEAAQRQALLASQGGPAPDQLFVVGLPMQAGEPPRQGGSRALTVIVVALLLAGIPAGLWWIGLFDGSDVEFEEGYTQVDDAPGWGG